MEEDMSGRKTVSIASSLTHRQAMVGGTAALVSAPFVIRSGFAQRAAVNIGVIQPLSGANAQFGINSRNGIELVADEINAAGGIKALGGAKINLVVSDATSNPTTAWYVDRRLRASRIPALLPQRQPLRHPRSAAAARRRSGNRPGVRICYSRFRERPR